MSSLKINRKNKNRQRGIALIEITVAMALLGLIAVGFLGGTQMTSATRVQADDRASAKIIAESVLDDIKTQDFASEYTVTLPSGYSGYTVTAEADYLRNNCLQRVTVQVSRSDSLIFELEGFKVQR